MSISFMKKSFCISALFLCICSNSYSQDYEDRYLGIHHLGVSMSSFGDDCTVDKNEVYESLERLSLSNIEISKYQRDGKNKSDGTLQVGITALQAESEQCAVAVLISLYGNINPTPVLHNPDYLVDLTTINLWFFQSIQDKNGAVGYSVDKISDALSLIDKYAVE